jgi:capsular exopolysaccharide synthesis family protein
VTSVSPESRAALAFRVLAATLTRLGSKDASTEHDSRIRGSSGTETILVTSAGPSEGKTTVVANLAAALAELGKRVLVFSCDFRRPLVHEFFGVSATPGLAESLATSNGQGVLDGSVWDSAIEHVSVVPSGRPPLKPGELLSSHNMRRALDEAKGLADIVILDTAPLLAEGDVAHLLPAIDEVLLVVRAGKTTQQMAKRAHEFLERLGAPVVGVVLTDTAAATVPHRYYGHRMPKERPEAVEVGGGSATASEDGPKGVGVGDFPDSHDTGSATSV